MIKVAVNSKCIREKKYVLDQIFSEFWSIPFWLDIDDSLHNEYRFYIGDKILSGKDIFFVNADRNWLGDDTMPDEHITHLDTSSFPLSTEVEFQDLPILYGIPNMNVLDNTINLDFDLLGAIFFMLSRYEEAVIKEKDIHGRFGAKLSHAFKNGYLHRPIVNEYLTLLWKCISHFDETVVKKTTSFRTILTCDVDFPYNPSNKYFSIFLRSFLSLFLKKIQLKEAFKILKEYLCVKLVDVKYDKNNTFDNLMSLAEEINEPACFYFITDKPAGVIDGNYTLNDPFIERLLSEINKRGHNIGLHASYSTFNNFNQLKAELSILSRKLEQLAILQPSIGNRQHYLRFDILQTVKYLNDCGFNYDSTLSYADVAGFRCGTCYEYFMYDLVSRIQLQIKQRPLIFMECSVIDDRYMGLGYTKEAIDYVLALKNECKKYGGNFVVLWHNSSFKSIKDLPFLKQILTD